MGSLEQWHQSGASRIQCYGVWWGGGGSCYTCDICCGVIYYKVLCAVFWYVYLVICWYCTFALSVMWQSWNGQHRYHNSMYLNVELRVCWSVIIRGGPSVTHVAVAPWLLIWLATGWRKYRFYSAGSPYLLSLYKTLKGFLVKITPFLLVKGRKYYLLNII